jgi:hypothetical protein
MSGTSHGTPVTSPGVTGTPAAGALARQYCTVADVIADLSPLTGGDEAAIMKHVRAANAWIDQRLGAFIPFIETKKFNGGGRARLAVPPLLAVTSIVNDDDTLVAGDYILMGGNEPGRMWENGPYTSLLVDPDATNLGAWYGEPEGVSITGRWGKYEKCVAAGVVVKNNPLASDGVALYVADGSKLSPGMGLLIGDEQILVAGVGDPSAAITTLSVALDSASETLTPVDVLAASVGEVIRVGFEKMKIVDKNATQWLVLRGWNNTKKSAHSISDSVDVYRTFAVERGVNGTTAAAHVKETAISRYLPPDDINLLARAIASLMKKLADSAYAGRVGNAELGQVFYNDAFPRDLLEKIEANYEVGV